MIRRHFDLEIMLNEYLQVYESLLAVAHSAGRRSVRSSDPIDPAPQERASSNGV
jgi:hypothetical protein